MIPQQILSGSKTFKSFDDCTRSPSEQNSCTRSKPKPIRSQLCRALRIRARSHSIAIRSDADLFQSGSHPVQWGSGSVQRSSCYGLCATVRSGSVSARPRCDSARLGSARLRLESGPFRCGSLRLCSVPARLLFVNVFFFSEVFFIYLVEIYDHHYHCYSKYMEKGLSHTLCCFPLMFVWGNVVRGEITVF